MEKVFKIFKQFPKIKAYTSTNYYPYLNFGKLDKNIIIANRQKFFQDINIDMKNCVFTQQIHNTQCTLITEKDKGKGIYNFESGLKDTDAMITKEKNIGLCIITADCIPVFIYDIEKEIIGIVHCGWKGIYNDILIKTLKKMIQNFGSKKENIILEFGPCIQSCCYKITDKKRLELFANKYTNNNIIKKNHLNITHCLYLDIIKFGISKKNINISTICTCCNTNFSSHYRERENRESVNINVIIK